MLSDYSDLGLLAARKWGEEMLTLLRLNSFHLILPELDITPDYEEKAYLPLMYQVPGLAIDEGP